MAIGSSPPENFCARTARKAARLCHTKEKEPRRPIGDRPSPKWLFVSPHTVRLGPAGRRADPHLLGEGAATNVRTAQSALFCLYVLPRTLHPSVSLHLGSIFKTSMSLPGGVPGITCRWLRRHPPRGPRRPSCTGSSRPCKQEAAVCHSGAEASVNIGQRTWLVTGPPLKPPAERAGSRTERSNTLMPPFLGRRQCVFGAARSPLAQSSETSKEGM